MYCNWFEVFVVSFLPWDHRLQRYRNKINLPFKVTMISRRYIPGIY